MLLDQECNYHVYRLYNINAKSKGYNDEVHNKIISMDGLYCDHA